MLRFKKARLPLAVSIGLGFGSIAEADILNDLPDNNTDSFTYEVNSTKQTAVLRTEIPVNYQYSIDTGSVYYTNANPGVGAAAENPMWQNTTLLGTVSGAHLNLIRSEIQLDNNVLRPATYLNYIGVQNLTIDNVEVNADAGFRFLDSTSNSVNLQNNASLKLSSGGEEIIIAPGSTLTINSSGGTNALYDWDNDVDNDVIFNVTDGTLIYGEPSFLSGSKNIIKGASSAINVSAGATFELRRIGLEITNGDVNLASAGTLKIHNGRLTVDTVNSTGGTTDLETNSDLYASTFNMNDGSTMNLGGSPSRAELTQMNLNGNNTINFSGGTLRIGSLTQGATPGALTVNGSSGIFSVQDLALNTGFNLVLEKDVYLELGSLKLDGGVLGLNQADINISGPISGNSSGLQTANITGLGQLIFEKGAELNLNANLNIASFSGLFEFNDAAALSGNGHIADQLTNVVFYSKSANTGYAYGILSPGDSTNVFGEISTDAKKWQFLSASNFDLKNKWSTISADQQEFIRGGSFHVDIGDNAGAPINDKLVYGDTVIDAYQLAEIVVRAPAGTHPSALIGKEFNIIELADSAAADGTANGEIQVLGRDLSDAIVEDASLPVLVDIGVKYDGVAASDKFGQIGTLTLVATEASTISLAKHQNLRPQRNAQQVAAMLPSTPPAASNVGATTLYNALQTMNNSQISPHFESVHAEPFSSQQTVRLAQTDELMNLVMRRAMLSYQGENSLAEQFRYSWVGGETGNPDLWADGSMVKGSIDGDNSLGNFDYDTQTFSFGSTFYRKGAHYAGAFFALADYSMKEHDAAVSDFDSEGYDLGIYGGGVLTGEWRYNYAAGLGFSSTETERYGTFNGITETAKADFDSTTYFLGSRAYQSFEVSEGLLLSPFIGLAYISNTQEEFSETNAPTLGLTVKESEANALISSLGVEIGTKALDVGISWSGHARYDHDFEANSSSEHETQAAFTHTGSYATFVGQNRGADTLDVGASIKYGFENNLAVSAGLSHAFHSNGSENGANLGVDWRF